LTGRGRRLLTRLVTSVRVRVTAAALLAVACALGVAVAVVDASLSHDRRHVLTTTAEDQARQVADYNPALTPPLVLPANATLQSGLVQVLRDNRVVGASRALRYRPPLWGPGDPVVQTNDVQLGLGRDVQVVSIPITTEGIAARVVVVTSLDQYDNSVAFVERIMYLGAPLLFVVVGGICWLIVGRALRPIELMRREVAEVATFHGAHRVAEPATDDEVGRLSRTLNSMLDRIEAFAERERRFVSDASHELRSPVANVRTAIEVALHRPDQADWPLVAHEVLSENERMDRLVEELLLLARSDEGGLIPASGSSDLAEVAGSVVARHESSMPPVVLRAEFAPVAVPDVYLERMVANLVDNARRFAATRVEVTVNRVGSSSLVEVRDDGPGVPESDRARIFERFVRLDEARDRGVGGFGLGLAIVSDLCRAYGGTVEVGDANPGAVFTLRFPLAPDPVPRILVEQPSPV
jgi:signal transduction histidine kinase